MSIPDDQYIGEPGYPAPWTTSMPREGLRDNDQARIISLAPDVCKSPGTPVPYPVVDFCGHDENYTTSVRFTRQKVMVMRSNTSHVHGDEPGIGKGVVSNTVGGISEPITHAAQVRAEGSPVIRHLDRFHMNNRNTVGEALFVKDVRAFSPPVNDDPAPGSLVRLADASGNWAKYAGPPPVDAPVKNPPIAGLPPTGNLPVPTSPPDGPAQPPGSGGPSLWTILRWARRGHLAYQGYKLAKGAYDDMKWGQANPEAYMAREALSKGGVENYDGVEREIHEDAIARIRRGDRLNEVREDYDNRLRDYRNEMELDELQHPEDAAAPTGDNVRVSQTEEYRKKCEVGRYGKMRKICGGYGMQAHHIVPDWTLRYGSRTSGDRIPNMPSLADGMAICVAGQAATNDTEHNRAHAADAAIEKLAVDAKPPHTAPLSGVVRESLDAMIKVRPDCEKEINLAVARQYTGKNPNQLLRAKRLPPLPPETTKALARGETKSLP
ncbi:DUF4150 domain-containing protein [Paracoccus pacificus]|uniref:DUF4150 domain-containing protein n=1 Tax=Paracoccus pacificus TaxID=1463598 RepID=A0ABW4R8S7_9RHOB